jgi:hypothetical protein
VLAALYFPAKHASSLQYLLGVSCTDVVVYLKEKVDSSAGLIGTGHNFYILAQGESVFVHCFVKLSFTK